MSISFGGMKKWIVLFIVLVVAGVGVSGMRYFKEQQNVSQPNNQVKSQANNEAEDVIKNKGGEQTAAIDYFIEYKLERDRIRDERKEMLRQIINNSETDLEMRQQAQKEIVDISQIIEKEMVIENLIKAKGFENAVLFMDHDASHVVVKAKSLDERQLMQIADVVSRNMNISSEKVTIIAKK